MGRAVTFPGFAGRKNPRVDSWVAKRVSMFRREGAPRGWGADVNRERLWLPRPLPARKSLVVAYGWGLTVALERRQEPSVTAAKEGSYER